QPLHDSRALRGGRGVRCAALLPRLGLPAARRELERARLPSPSALSLPHPRRELLSRTRGRRRGRDRGRAPPLLQRRAWRSGRRLARAWARSMAGSIRVLDGPAGLLALLVSG